MKVISYFILVYLWISSQPFIERKKINLNPIRSTRHINPLIFLISFHSKHFPHFSFRTVTEPKENKENAMAERVEGEGSNKAERNNSSYHLQPLEIDNEDILFCVDIDPQSMAEMKGVTGPNGGPLTRLDAIKQAIVLFVNAKLTINPQHRFAFATLSNSASWVIHHSSLFLLPNPNFIIQSIGWLYHAQLHFLVVLFIDVLLVSALATTVLFLKFLRICVFTFTA